jgi:hypothetical protein
MRKYEIESFHHVCDDDFEKGESDQVSSYDSIQSIYAIDWEEAIDIYLEKHLYTKLNFYDLELNLENNCFESSFLQKIDGYVASIEDIELWKRGNLQLQSNSFQLIISEITRMTI